MQGDGREGSGGQEHKRKFNAISSGRKQHAGTPNGAPKNAAARLEKDYSNLFSAIAENETTASEIVLTEGERCRPADEAESLSEPDLDEYEDLLRDHTHSPRPSIVDSESEGYLSNLSETDLVLCENQPALGGPDHPNLASIQDSDTLAAIKKDAPSAKLPERRVGCRCIKVKAGQWEFDENIDSGAFANYMVADMVELIKKNAPEAIVELATSVARELHDMLYSNVLMYCDDILCWNY